ncbi:HK97 family phage prohead protease [Caloramator sp. E03]|uniref:HK97 family phage prohead protease n=1 Tax=Caloramator sp. E03 TaxID=2576307 RepID=UPI001FA96838|nr:HK97 family phage prohead protease [Caloramator sp. E03]
MKYLMGQMERRTINLEELRVNNTKQDSDEVRVIEGHAAVFDKWSEELGLLVPFKEKVLKGAFKESIEKDDIRALFNHDANFVLGRNKSGTLFLEEDEKGLKVRIIPPDTQWARDLLVSIERGDISQMSFGFTVLEDRWGYQDGIDVRELVKVKLFDVSPVTFPAYTETDVGVRTILDEYNRRKQTRIDEERMKNIKKLQLLKKKYELLGK